MKRKCSSWSGWESNLGPPPKKQTWSSKYANHYTMPHPQKLFCHNSDHSDLSGCSPYFSKPWMIIHSKLGIGFITVINQMSQSCIVLFQFPEIKKILSVERRKISKRRQINLQDKSYSKNYSKNCGGCCYRKEAPKG